MNLFTTKIILASLLVSGALAAFPIEPFDMHCTIGHFIEEKLAEMTNRGREDIISPVDNSSSSDNKETSNDVDTGNSQDCR